MGVTIINSYMQVTSISLFSFHFLRKIFPHFYYNLIYIENKIMLTHYWAFCIIFFIYGGNIQNPFLTLSNFSTLGTICGNIHKYTEPLSLSLSLSYIYIIPNHFFKMVHYLYNSEELQYYTTMWWYFESITHCYINK